MGDVQEQFQLAGGGDAPVGHDMIRELAGLLLADVAARIRLPEVIVGEGIHIETGPVGVLHLAGMVEMEDGLRLLSAHDAVGEDPLPQRQHVFSGQPA